MKVTSLFPIQIAFGSLPGISRATLRGLKSDCLTLSLTDSAGIQWSTLNYVNGYTSYGSIDQLQTFSTDFEILTKALRKQAVSYTKALGWNLKSLEMTDCWANVMSHEGYHTSHIHPGSLISGTFYVTCPKGSGGLRLEDPNLTARMVEPVDSGISNEHRKSRQWLFQPKAGQFIFFPSWLRHEVLPCKNTLQPRISISFNFLQD